MQGEYGERLALRAESYLRNSIRCLWTKFDKCVDHVTNQTRCVLADDPPVKKTDGTIEVTIHKKKCLEGRCNNANFFRSMLPEIRRLCDALDKLDSSGVTLSNELFRAREELRMATLNPSRLYNYTNCLSVGDVWIHLECLKAKVKAFATTNYKESQHLCPILDLEIKLPYERSSPGEANGATPADGPRPPTEAKTPDADNE